MGAHQGAKPALVAAGSAYSAVVVWQLPAACTGSEGSTEHHMCSPLYLLQGHSGVIHRYTTWRGVVLQCNISGR